MMMSGSRYEAKIYSSRKPSTDRDHTILLVPSAIDNKAEVAALYSLYAIGLNIDRITPDDDMFYSSVRSSAMAVGADYFAGSFSDSPYYGVVFPFAIPSTLWEFRQKLGREFTDRLMAYTMRAFNESIYRKTKEDQVAYLCQT